MFGMNKSIFRRLLFSYLFIIFIGLGLVGILTSYLVKDYIYENSEKEIIQKAKSVNALLMDATSKEDIKNIIVFLDKSFNNRLWVFDKDGEIISTSSDNEVYVGKAISDSIVKRVLKGENVISNLEFEGLTEPMLSVVVPWGKEENVFGGIVLHAPIVGLNDTVRSIREIIVWIILLSTILTTALVSYLSWSISKPLSQIDKAASEIGVGNYKKRIYVSSDDEIGDLANTINSMAEKLERVDEDRNKLDEIRKDFLANASHELKTPLTAMQGFLEALQDDLITDEISRKKYYDVMYLETLHMNRLIEDLMHLTKLENKEIRLKKQLTSIEKLITNIQFRFEQEVLDKGLELKVFIEEGIDVINADSDRLEQILNNIIKNAVKFTNKGSITIHVSNDRDFILFSISDTGIGISIPDQERIWERFFKVDRGRAKRSMGTGLGLSIVKELVHMHDGFIALHSELDKGSTFKIWLPKE